MSGRHRRTAKLGVLLLVICAPIAAASASVVTVYSVDGLRDGRPNWYNAMFRAFKKQTGIEVQYVEAGSGVIVNRVLAERAAAQADVLVTIPPFMQVAAAAGVLQPTVLPAAESAAIGTGAGAAPWHPLAMNYSAWIYDAAALPAPPPNYAALIAPRYRNRIQYSTPGQAGDGTAVLLSALRMYGSRQGAFDYLRQLQANNLGPSSSTGRLAALVNKGEIWIANGDLQMSFAQQRQFPNIRLFFPAAPDGKRYAMAIPYQIALVKGAPHPRAGLRLIEFLLGKSAQARLCGLAGTFPVRRDVPARGANAQTLKRIMRGVTVWVPNWNQVAKDLRADIDLWNRATGN